MADLDTGEVVRAIHALGAINGAWPTTKDLARYLDAKPPQIKNALGRLRGRRIVLCVRSEGKARWMPWDR